jgi:hypothetical protein
MDFQTNEPIGALIPRKRLAQDLGVCPRTVVNLAKRAPPSRCLPTVGLYAAV